MWLLISERGESFLITPREEHIVSRKGGSITLSDDQSISRLHAKVLLDNDDSNCNCGLILVDTSSKYGTYVNDGLETATRIPTNEKILVKHNDIVRFGLQWNKWRVVFMPLLVLTSTLKQPEKQQVKSQIETLGGKMISNWSSQCTHLTMDQIKLTVKVVSALGAGQHIVTPKYWQNLLLAVQTKQGSIPEPTDYIPPLDEATLNENQVSFKVNRDRSTLFKNVLFVAASLKQKTIIEPMVISAGGKIAIFDECNLTKDDFCKKNVILMQASPFLSQSDEQSQIPASYQIISDYLSSKRLRCIPESDIGLSIVYCSCERFCNPRYDAQSIFENRPAPLQQTESLRVIAQDTQNSPVQPSDPGKVVDETIALSGKRNKRPPSDNDENQRPFKMSSTVGGGKEFVHDIASYKKDKLPEIIENDSFVYNCKTKKDYQQENNNNQLTKNQDDRSKKSNVMEIDNEESLRTDSQSEEIFKNKGSKKRLIVSDDEDEINEFFLLSQKRKISRSSSKDNVIEKVKNVVVDDSDDDDDFSFSSKKKPVQKPSAGSFDSEQDIFDPSLKNDDNRKSLKSVDMFDTMPSCSSNQKDKNQSNSFECTSKNSVDIFDFTGSSKKSVRNIKGNDFELSDVRSAEKRSYDALQNNNVVDKSPKTTNNCNDDLKKDNDNPFQNNKLSRDIFEPSTSDARNAKLRKLADERPNERLNVIIDETENNDISGNKPCKISPEKIFIKQEIKKEPTDATIVDEELHDSSVIVVKSLIVPLKNATISNQSERKKKTAVNFKKFKKVTPLKMPNFIDLVAYEEKNNGCWANITSDSDDDDNKDDGWSFRQSQALKGTKSKSRRAR